MIAGRIRHLGRTTTLKPLFEKAVGIVAQSGRPQSFSIAIPPSTSSLTPLGGRPMLFAQDERKFIFGLTPDMAGIRLEHAMVEPGTRASQRHGLRDTPGSEETSQILHDVIHKAGFKYHTYLPEAPGYNTWGRDKYFHNDPQFAQGLRLPERADVVAHIERSRNFLGRIA